MAKSSKKNMAPKIEQASGLSVFIVCACAFILCMILLMQGGYHPVAAGFGGICVSIMIAVGVIFAKAAKDDADDRGIRVSGISLVSVLLCLVGIGYLISACINGLSLTSLQRCCIWFLGAGACEIARMLDPNGRKNLLTIFCWVIIVSSVVGLAMYSGFEIYEGSMVGRRLMFFHQYANVAAVWFAVGIFLAPLSKRTMGLVLLPFCAMLATGSVGSGMAFIVGAIALICLYLKSRKSDDDAIGGFRDLVCTYIWQLILGAAMFAACHALPLFSLVIAALFVALSLFSTERIAELLAGFLGKKPIIFMGCAVVIVVAFAVVVALIYGGRIQEAGQTFTERYIQISDGLNVLALSPVLGIGPDAWHSVYENFQSAQYDATFVHCGYVQILLDGGIVALLFFLAAVVLGIRNMAKSRLAWLTLPSSCLILTHALIDLDLVFASSLFLLGIFFGCGTDNRDHNKFEVLGNGRIPDIVLAVVLAAFSTFNIYSQFTFSHIKADAYEGNSDAIEKTMEGNALVADDKEALKYLYLAYSVEGNTEKMLETLSQDGLSSEDIIILSSGVLNNDKNSELAKEKLVEVLEQQPFNHEIHIAALDLFKEYGLSQQLQERVDAAIANADSLINQGNAALLNNQKKVEDGE